MNLKIHEEIQIKNHPIKNAVRKAKYEKTLKYKIFEIVKAAPSTLINLRSPPATSFTLPRNKVVKIKKAVPISAWEILTCITTTIIQDPRKIKTGIMSGIILFFISVIVAIKRRTKTPKKTMFSIIK